VAVSPSAVSWRRSGQVCCPALVSLSSRFGRALVLRVCLGGASLSSSRSRRRDGQSHYACLLLPGATLLLLHCRSSHPTKRSTVGLFVSPGATLSSLLIAASGPPPPACSQRTRPRHVRDTSKTCPEGSTAGIVTGRFCAGVFAASVPQRRRRKQLASHGRGVFTVAGCEQVPVAQAAATDIVSALLQSASARRRRSQLAAVNR